MARVYRIDLMRSYYTSPRLVAQRLTHERPVYKRNIEVLGYYEDAHKQVWQRVAETFPDGKRIEYSERLGHSFAFGYLLGSIG